jgi:hypothetical protein
MSKNVKELICFIQNIAELCEGWDIGPVARLED